MRAGTDLKEKVCARHKLVAQVVAAATEGPGVRG
jgi:hypothetical protein